MQFYAKHSVLSLTTVLSGITRVISFSRDREDTKSLEFIFREFRQDLSVTFRGECNFSRKFLNRVRGTSATNYVTPAVSAVSELIRRF